MYTKSINLFLKWSEEVLGQSAKSFKVFKEIASKDLEEILEKDGQCIMKTTQFAEHPLSTWLVHAEMANRFPRYATIKITEDKVVVTSPSKHLILTVGKDVQKEKVIV